MRSLAQTKPSGADALSNLATRSAVGRIVPPDLRRRRIEAGMEDGVAEAGGARIHGGCRAGQPDEDGTPAALRKKMCRHQRAGSAIVERDEIVMPARRIRLDGPIEQHEGNAGVSERSGDRPIDRQPGRGMFEGGEEHPVNLPRDVLSAQLSGLDFLSLGRLRHGAPHEAMGRATGRVHQSTCDGGEDLDVAEIRNQHTERQRSRGGAALLRDEAARPRTPFDQSGQLQLVQRTRNGDPGRAELLHEVGLAGQPPTRDDAPGHDLPEKRFIDLAVLRRRNDGG